MLDPAPPRRLEPNRLALIERGDPEEIVRALVREPVTARALEERGLFSPPELARGLAALEQAGDWYFAPEWLEGVCAVVRERLARRVEESPLDPGLPLAELLPPEPWAQAIAPLLHVERRGAKAYLPGAAPKLGEKAEAAEELEAQLAGNDVIPLASFIRRPHSYPIMPVKKRLRSPRSAAWSVWFFKPPEDSI